MGILGYLLNLAINVYIFIIVVQVAVSWLIAFDVINAENEKAKNLIVLLKRATDPVYKPIQKYVPPVGGIDITPLIVIVVLSLIQGMVIGPLFY
jgi:YggT family protein